MLMTRIARPLTALDEVFTKVDVVCFESFVIDKVSLTLKSRLAEILYNNVVRCNELGLKVFLSWAVCNANYKIVIICGDCSLGVAADINSGSLSVPYILS